MDFYSFNSFSKPELLIEEAIQLKTNRSEEKLLCGKTMALVFLNPSLRTRVSTHEACNRLGINVIAFNSLESWGWEIEEGIVMDSNKPEHVKDAAQVLSQYVDIIGIRSFAGLIDREADKADAMVKSFMRYASVPVVNMESSMLHPLQSLTDMITIKEMYGSRKDLKVVLSWMPHPKVLPLAVGQSFSEWSLGMGYDLTICHPLGYNLDEDYTHGAKISHDLHHKGSICTSSWHK